MAMQDARFANDGEDGDRWFAKFSGAKKGDDNNTEMNSSDDLIKKLTTVNIFHSKRLRNQNIQNN